MHLDPNSICQWKPRFIDAVETPVDYGEVLRYLGYPAEVEPGPALRQEFDHWINEANRRATPRAIYILLPVADKSRRRLRLQTASATTDFLGAIGEFLGAARAVAVFIATAGAGVERLASELMQEGDNLAAMVVNAVGAERAEAAETAVIEDLRARASAVGFAPTLPYSPGYCGMALTEQTKLFALFDVENVGVQLSKSCLMHPLKSVSGLIGIGPADEIEDAGSPCDRCELYNCGMRR